MGFRKRQSAAFDDDAGSGDDAPQLKKARVGKDAAKGKVQQTKQISNISKQKDKDGNSFWEVSSILFCQLDHCRRSRISNRGYMV